MAKTYWNRWQKPSLKGRKNMTDNHRTLLEQALRLLDEATTYTGSKSLSSWLTHEILGFCVKVRAELVKPKINSSLPEITQEDREFLSYNPNTDDIVEWIEEYAKQAVANAELAKPVELVEPVAWMDDFGNAFPIGARKGAGSWMDAHQRNWKPLYLHPPTPAQHDAPEVSALKEERDKLLLIIKKVAAWNRSYPSSRVYGYGGIKKIAAEMDAIYVEACAAIAKAEWRTE